MGEDNSYLIVQCIVSTLAMFIELFERDGVLKKLNCHKEGVNLS